MKTLSEQQVTTLMKQATEKIKGLQTALDHLKDAQHEPIAIIGMGCRFPGADTPDAYWELLSNGVDAIREVPKDRWDIDEYYAYEPATPGKIHTRYGGFLEQLTEFDPQFFQISGREAVSLDPQQRLLLEVSWEALENAALTGDDSPSRTGVFVGVCDLDYRDVIQRNGHGIDAYFGSGNTFSTASGRLSYYLGLTGPNLAIDTACSSSLVAISLAVNSLRQQECDAALAGGVQYILSPMNSISFSQAQMLSRDGRCKTFDASADGYVRSEGCGMIVLKRLSDATANGDNILAVIRGVATNHDGYTSGLTVPSGPAQQAVIRQALVDGAIKPEQVSYIEAHGTGTSLGDPIEMGALNEVFGQRSTPLFVGSAKSNIGHAEAAAGIAGLMKVVLAMQHGEIPPNLHFNQPSSHIEWEKWPIQVPTQCTTWKDPAHPDASLFAGVSSFGFSGTNSHVVLESAPLSQIEAQIGIETAIERTHHLLTLSTKTPKALQELAQQYARYLTNDKKGAQQRLADVCYSANIGRRDFQYRHTVTAESKAVLSKQLRTFTEIGLDSHDIIIQDTRSSAKIAFLFTGQGSQYSGMGSALYETSPIFRETLDHCDEILQSYLEYSLVDILYSATCKPANLQPATLQPATLLNNTTYTQPALFALEYALATLWQSWGIQPTMLMGHSVGEIVAACVAGVFSLEDGLKLIAARSQLMGALPAGGEMVSFLCGDSTGSSFEAVVAEAISSYKSEVSIAAVNGPQSIVISGDGEAVQHVTEELTHQGIKARRLTVSHAFHSPFMEPMLDDFHTIAQSITYHPPKLPLVSNITGKLAGDEILTSEYWVRHVREAVRFGDGVTTLHDQDIDIFLEIGPGGTLLGMTQAIYDFGFTNYEEASANEGALVNPKSEIVNPVTLPSLRKNQDDWQQMLTSLGELYVRGVEIDWQGLDQPYSRQKVQLPNYPFQRERYWVETTAQRNTATLSPLTDKLTQSPRLKEIVSETEMSVARLPFLADYRLFGEVVSPAACHLAMVLDAAQLAYLEEAVQLVDIALPQALSLGEGETRTVQVVFDDAVRAASSAYGQKKEALISSFELISFNAQAPNSTLQTHASGHLALKKPDPAPVVDLASVQSRCTTTVDVNGFYANRAVQRIQLGSAFRWLAEVWAGGREIIGRLVLPESIDSVAGYTLHPALLEACFQLVSTHQSANEEAVAVAEDETILPFTVDTLTVLSTLRGDEWWGYAQQIGENKWHIQILDSVGNVVVQVGGFTQRTISRHELFGIEPWHEWLYELRWMKQEPHSDLSLSSPQMEAGQTWLLFADQAGLGEAVAAQLQAEGDRPVLVYPGTAFEPHQQDVYADDEQVTPIYRIRVDHVTDYQNLLSTLTQTVEIDRVLFLWGLDAVHLQTGGDTDHLEQNVREMTVSALHLLHTLLEQSMAPQLWFVTQDTQSILPGDSANHFVQALLWGLGRTVALEYPELCSQLIDLDGNVPLLEQAAPLATRLREEWVDLSQTPAQNDHAHKAQIALRGNRWYTASLDIHKPNIRNSEEHDSTTMSIRPDATYLLTGGLGGLGLEVARWLVTEGATHLMLLGRSQPNASAQRKIAELEEMGATIMIMQADVSQRDSLRQVLAQVPTDYPLRGIIHAAGVLDDAALLQQRWAHFEKAYAPKVMGTWHLYTLTQEKSLDFLVFFSSSAGLFGGLGQANYAAANTFLDSFAHHLRANSMPAISIGWGAWSKVGLAAEMATHVNQQMAARGEGFIDPVQGVNSLGYLLQQGLSHAAVLPIEWQTVLNTEQKEHALFTALVAQFESKSSFISIVQEDTTSSIIDQLKEASPAEREQLLLDHVQQQVAQVLQSKELLATHRPFTELGMDSLMAVELRRRLVTSLQLQLSATIAFDYPTANRLATFLLDELTEQFASDTSEQEPATEEHNNPEEMPPDALGIPEDEAELDIDSLEELLALEALLQEMD